MRKPLAMELFLLVGWEVMGKRKEKNRAHSKQEKFDVPLAKHPFNCV